MFEGRLNRSSGVEDTVRWESLQTLPLLASLFKRDGEKLFEKKWFKDFIKSVEDRPTSDKDYMDQYRSIVSNQIIKYYYESKNGYLMTYHVGMKGYVERIDVHGIDKSKIIRTNRGISIGDNYNRVIGSYGFPLSQRLQDDGTLYMDYTERAGVAFYILGNRVVGISVALPD